MIRDHRLFFEYYLPSLEKALAEDYIDYGYHSQDPSWFYPEEMLLDMDAFEEAHYDEYRLFHTVPLYFDAISHYFPEVENGLSPAEYKELIKRLIAETKEQFGITHYTFRPERTKFKTTILAENKYMIEFPPKDKQMYLDKIENYLKDTDPEHEVYNIDEVADEYIIIHRTKTEQKRSLLARIFCRNKRNLWTLSEIGLSDDLLNTNQ